MTYWQGMGCLLYSLYMRNKSELREYSKNIRRSLDMKSISAEIVSNIRQADFYKNARDVMIFYPLPNEVDLLGLLADNKKFYLPRMKGELLEGDELKCARYNIYEPTTDALTNFYPDIVFVPALCADTCCNRIGYGGGFYDRFLLKLRSAETKTRFYIALPEELLEADLPVCDTDMKCDGIITQKKSLFSRG